jgi:hypothetical protein
LKVEGWARILPEETWLGGLKHSSQVGGTAMEGWCWTGRARLGWAGAVWFRTTGSGSHLTNALDINVLFLAPKFIGVLAVLATEGITAIMVPSFLRDCV